jgi:hypothetical protein
MLRVPLEILPDVDDSRLALVFVGLQVEGRSVRALLDSGASRSAVVEWPGLVGVDVSADSAGVFGVLGGDRHAQVAVAFAGRDLGAMQLSVVPADHPGHGNLVGQDVLANFRTEYRLAEGILVLDGDPPEDARDVHLDAGRHVYVDVTWPTGEAASAVIDTGASMTVVDERFASQHTRVFTHEGMSEGTDARGTVLRTPVVRMAAIHMLGAELETSPAAIVNLSAANATVERRIDLILGWPILSQGTLTIDHRLQVASFQPRTR